MTHIAMTRGNIFCTFKTHYLSRNAQKFAYPTNTISQRIYIIMYGQSMQFFKEFSIFRTNNVYNFSKKIACTLNEHSDPSSLLNFVSANYTNFRRTLKILHVQHTQFFKKQIACP